MGLQKHFTMIFLLGIFGANCSSQDNQGNTTLTDRQPVVAGQFYAASPGQLQSDLENLFARAEPRHPGRVMALISPHAGYVFSGEVAASAFNQLDPDFKAENIFILASSHRLAFEGASIYDQGNYKTPLGKVEVNLDLARKLVKDHPVFSDRADAHLYEHSLEVQLPFLQYKLGTGFRIVPIIMGAQTPATCRKVADALEPYLNDKNLFVISTDFSHYPSYEDAVRVDKLTADAIIANSSKILQETLENNDDKGIHNLATSLCGWTSVLTLVYMTEGRTDLQFESVRYMNSGDSPLYGDKDRVVGYHAIAVRKKKPDGSQHDFSLSDDEKMTLLNIARSAISEYLASGQKPEIGQDMLSDRLKDDYGAFVTLMKDGSLRGCIGRFEASEPLYAVVREMAISAAVRDHRFPPVSDEEVGELVIEISVLTPLRRIQSVDEIELGKHGIYIKKGFNSGTFLPQVATETGWTLEEFLGHCARDKAGIGWDGWKDAELYIYEAYVFSEDDIH
jgi:hypothetical protein